jgi:hypothetical protein
MCEHTSKEQDNTTRLLNEISALPQPWLGINSLGHELLQLKNDPEFWLALAACADGDFAKMDEWQQARKPEREKSIAVLGHMPELGPFLIHVRDTLHSIARLRSFPLERPDIELRCCLPTDEVVKGANGILEVKPYVGARQLEGQFRDFLNGLDSRRLRECQTCNGVFWARRTDRRYCSEACGNRLRVKKWSENPDNREKAKRRRQQRRAETKGRRDDERL